MLPTGHFVDFGVNTCWDHVRVMSPADNRTELRTALRRKGGTVQQTSTGLVRPQNVVKSPGGITLGDDCATGLIHAGHAASDHDIHGLCARAGYPGQRPVCLRLAHDETVQHPERPGWAVYCVETGPELQRELTVSVVIPAKNEARNLPTVLPQIPKHNTEVVIVDGASSDATVQIVQELCPKAVLVSQPARGKGHAMATGFGMATGDVIVAMDGDGSMSPREIPALVNALVTGADFAKGSRTLGGSADLTRVRDLGNQALNLVFNRLHGTTHTDLCYGYMAFWRDHLSLLTPDCAGFEVETWMNVRAARAGLEIAEVASYEGRRVYGESNLHPFRDGLRVGRTLLRESFRGRSRR